jgi:hypothetical protein
MKFTMNPGGVTQRNVISAAEMEENFERHEDGGRCFRVVLFFIVLAIVILLSIMKYDVEYNVTPLLEDQSNPSEPAPIVDPVAAKYYSMLKVSVEQREADAEKAMSEKDRRRERWRLRQAAKNAYEGHENDHTALTTCGRSCEATHKQMQLAYHMVNAKVDRDLYKVLDVENTASTNRDTLKTKYEELKAKVKEDTDEDTQIALAELKDAVEILSNPETRAYYNLYGERPPEEMKKTSARSGGWGQEFAFARSVHMKIMMQILNYIDSYWADMAVMGFCVLFVGLAMWAKYPELMEMVERMEAHETKMKEMSQREKTE